jgi:hypothetical protein
VNKLYPTRTIFAYGEDTVFWVHKHCIFEPSVPSQLILARICLVYSVIASLFVPDLLHLCIRSSLGHFWLPASKSGTGRIYNHTEPPHARNLGNLFGNGCPEGQRFFGRSRNIVIGKRSTAILIAEEDWHAIQETLHLTSIPGMRESIREGFNAPVRNAMRSLTGELAAGFRQSGKKDAKKIGQSGLKPQAERILAIFREDPYQNRQPTRSSLEIFPVHARAGSTFNIGWFTKFGMTSRQ